MKRSLTLCILLLTFLAGSGYSQDTRFGKNKVQYKDFDWKYIQTRHFDIYFYENAYPTAKFAGIVLEASYQEIVEELDYRISRRVPVFIYNSHNDFQQTNIISVLLPEGIGGFTEAIKNRIAVPFTGSYEDFRHVLHHELTHAMTYDMLYGNMLGSLLSRQRLFQMPAWLAEGYAEYSSRHGWDYMSDMYMRDATINNYLIPPQYLGGFLAYKQGQAMIKYIADKYGEKKLGAIFQKGKIHLTMNKALKAVLGIDEEKLWEDFSKDMKRRYWPELARRKEADEIGQQLTHAREDGSYFNEKPAFSPEGDRIAIFTDKSDYTEIVLISAFDGKVIERLVKAERSGDLESLHSYVSGMSFSPDGREIVFVAKSKGKEAICFLDVSKKDIYKKKRLDFYNILSPMWSPDGDKIAFSALDGHKRDLFLYHISSDRIEQLTDDRFDDVDPSWLPNSSELIFASDRPHPQNPVMDHLGHPYAGPEAYHPGDFDYGTYNLFRVETAGYRTTPVDVGPGFNIKPNVSPDGERIAFISNRTGIDNIYIGRLDSTDYYAVTDVLTGIRDLSWSPDGTQLAYSSLFRGAYDIFLLEELEQKIDSGGPAPTDYVLGRYNLLDPDQKGRIALKRIQDDIADKTEQTATTSGAAQALADADSDKTDPEAPDSTGETDIAISSAITVDDTTEVDDEPAQGDVDDSASVRSGIHDDEYVYESDEKVSLLDSLFTDIGVEDDVYQVSMEESPEFDSVPPLLPDGEYRINKYTVKFTPDYIGGGFAYDTFFGLRGQTYFIFSDYLGNHQIFLATDLVSSIDQSFVQAFYINNENRINLGAGIFHTKNFYFIDNYGDNYYLDFSDRFYGVQGFASRPFSTFSRIELTASQYFIDRKYYPRSVEAPPPPPNRSSKATTANLAWVFDNVLWGYTGPVNGRRAKLSINAGVNLFDARDIEFYSAEFDYRKYWHFAKTFSMALRVSGGASFGSTPKQYFLGGTTNWIGNRTLDAKVWDVENLYFSDVVTPLRGEKYYDLSGNRYALINWEFRFPMIQYLAMRYPLPLVLGNVTGALFTDIGAAWTDGDFKGGTSEDDRKRLRDIKTGFGFGMRMNLFGFALLRYDVAWSTDFRTIAEKPRHYFSFGADF